MVSQISGVLAPLVIHEPDVLLLSYFLQSGDAGQTATEFINHPWVQTWLPQIQAPAMLQRIEQFKQAGLFAASHRPTLV